MYYAPFCLIFNGYWLLDNRQIFDNLWQYRMSSLENMPSGHLVTFRLCQSTPLFFISMCALVLLAVNLLIPLEKRVRMGLATKDAAFDVFESLPNYWRTLKRQ